MSSETAPSFPAAITNEEKRAIGNVVERLQNDFKHLSTDRVVTTVREVHERYTTARVRDFVPLFVERHATDELNQD